MAAQVPREQNPNFKGKMNGKIMIKNVVRGLPIYTEILPNVSMTERRKFFFLKKYKKPP